MAQQVIRAENNIDVDPSKRVYVKVKGGSAMAYYCEAGCVVSDLVELVHVKLRLSVRMDSLSMYQSEEAFKGRRQAFEADADVKGIVGTGEGQGQTAREALYVHYEEVEETSGMVDAPMEAMRAEMAHLRAEIEGVLRPVVNITCKIGPAESSTRGDPLWNKKVKVYYDSNSCVLLSALTKSEGWKSWEFETDLSRNTVAEHIFPQDAKFAGLAKHIGIEIDDERNGLPLLKHIEQQYGNGHIMLLPLADPAPGFTALKVIVARNISNDPILVGRREQLSMSCHRGRVVRKIKFGHLHELEVRLKARPFHRSLYQKALLAFDTHGNEFPNPADSWEVFRSGCDKMELLRQLFMVNVEPA